MSIYLHFLDRELTASLDRRLDAILAQNAIVSFLIFSHENFYCGFSLIFESCATNVSLFDLMFKLMTNSILFPVSSHPTVREFFSSRRIIYEHDAGRYPMYFRKEYYQPILEQPISLLHKNISTTASLEGELTTYISNYEKIAEDAKISRFAKANLISETLKAGLAELGPKAVTFAAFRQYFSSSDSGFESFAMRRLISHLYSTHYLSHLGSEIITGLGPYSYYDYLARRFPLYDFQICQQFLRFFFNLSVQFPPGLVNNAIQLWGSPEQTEFVAICRRILEVFTAAYILKTEAEDANLIAMRNWVLVSLPKFIFRNSPPARMPPNRLADVYHNATRYLIRAFDECIKNNIFYEAAKSIQTREQNAMIKILVCTAADIETRTFVSYATGEGIPHERHFTPSLSALEFKVEPNTKIFLVQSQKGSVGPGASLLTVSDAIKALSPNFVILLGIAFGISPKEQAMGDVLVSRHVKFYEPQRIGDRVISRGDKISADPVLFSRFDIAKVTWKRAKIHTGVLLSGEKLVDSASFKKKLLREEPEAIGGEMEAAGMISACYKVGVPWIVMKGICDWAEAKDDSNQELAAKNAVDLFWHILKDKGWT